MAVRYRAVNASAITENSDLTIATGGKDLQFDINKLIYTVPNGCTAKVNYMRGSYATCKGEYLREGSSIDSTLFTQTKSINIDIHVALKTNGKTLHRVLVVSAKDYKEDISSTYMYLNAGDQLYMTNGTHAGFNISSDSLAHGYTNCTIVDHGYVYLSIIEEYND